MQQAGTHEEELQGEGGKREQVGKLGAAVKTPALASQAGLTQFVGGSPIVTLDIQGVAVEFVVDTGSLISTLSEEFFDQHLKERFHGRTGSEMLFTVRAANGLGVPYSQYFLLDVAVGDASRRAPGLLGTNVLCKLPSFMTDLYNLGASVRTATDSTKTYGSARVCGSDSIQVPANSMLWIPVRGQVPDTAVFEPLGQLPGGLVVPSVVTEADKFVVPVCKMSSQEVSLNGNTRLGVLRLAVLVRPGLTVDVASDELVVSVQESLDSVPDRDHQFGEKIERICSTFRGNAQELDQFKLLLQRYRILFAVPDAVLGCVSTVKHCIPTVNSVQLQLSYRRIPPPQLAELREHLDSLLQQCVIRESESNFASPIVLVRILGPHMRLQPNTGERRRHP